MECLVQSDCTQKSGDRESEWWRRWHHFPSRQSKHNTMTECAPHTFVVPTNWRFESCVWRAVIRQDDQIQSQRWIQMGNGWRIKWFARFFHLEWTVILGFGAKLRYFAVARANDKTQAAQVLPPRELALESLIADDECDQVDKLSQVRTRLSALVHFSSMQLILSLSQWILWASCNDEAGPRTPLAPGNDSGKFQATFYRRTRNLHRRHSRCRYTAPTWELRNFRRLDRKSGQPLVAPNRAVGYIQIDKAQAQHQVPGSLGIDRNRCTYARSQRPSLWLLLYPNSCTACARLVRCAIRARNQRNTLQQFAGNPGSIITRRARKHAKVH